MADIELVIKMPEDIYKDIITHNRERREDGMPAYYFEGLIQNGTLLPKGHGDLIDKKVAYMKFYVRCLGGAAGEVFAETPTIVEADKAERSGEK